MSQPTVDDLAKIVVARSAGGALVAVGIVVSYCEAPTVSIATPDGDRIHWRADLCEVLPLADDVSEYIGRGIIDREGDV